MHLSGPVYTHAYQGQKRTFSILTLPFGDFVRVCESHTYDAMTGEGEQRHVFMPHARKLRTAIKQGEYTPTAVYAGLSDSHKATVALEGDSFTLDVPEDDKLPMTDGGHRTMAMGLLLAEAMANLEAATTPRAKEEAQAEVNEVNALPIPMILHLEGGDSQLDFLRLQMRRPVDKAHHVSLRIQKLLHDPDFSYAFELAKRFYEEKKSPFKGFIRFDSHRQDDALVKSIPISTLTAKNSSDLSTSMVGMAKVARSFGMKEVDVVRYVLDAYQHLLKVNETLFEESKVLTIPVNKGTKGSATMLVGLGIPWLYRLGSLFRKKPTEEDHLVLERAAKTIDEEVSGSFSAQDKRVLMGRYARALLKDRKDEEEMHDGLPLGLLKLTSASTFAAKELPGVKRRGRPRKDS